MKPYFTQFFFYYEPELDKKGRICRKEFNSMSLAAIILCAGNGTRMKSNLPKVLHKLAGFPLIYHVMNTVQDLGVTKTVIVAGKDIDKVSDAAFDFNKDVIIKKQEKQLGTGHAVKKALQALKDFDDDVIILYGDVPFITPATVNKMLTIRKEGSDLVVLGFEASQPGAYGRIIATSDKIEKIVEAKDASDAELQIKSCNSGVILTNSKNLTQLVKLLKNNNASKEYYLTDIVAIANSHNQKCSLLLCSETETLGINTRHELAYAENLFQNRTREKFLDIGVTLASPETTIFSLDTVIGRDTFIGQNVVFEPGVTIETGAIIKPFCHLESCHIGSCAEIGPFARIRPGTEIGNSARIGNFVETKNAKVGEFSKINHLSYVGDTVTGQKVNIGAGTITCNYDGLNKHVTIVEDGAFIGSNSSLIAPIKIEQNSIIAAGSVITKDVPKNSLSISRSNQKNLLGRAKEIMKKLKKIKATTKKANK